VFSILVAAIVGVLALWWMAGGSERLGAVEASSPSNLWLVFLTGLSVGGLSCLAVQGGLLAAVIAQREQRAQGRPAGTREHMAPVGLFLIGKVAAYTVLGAILGAFGARIPLSMQGWLLLAAGVFMLVVALQLVSVHPALRRLSFTPPKRVQRLVRRSTRTADGAGPLLVGGLPCSSPAASPWPWSCWP
jgi:sulfite exporter TauE/SafE